MRYAPLLLLALATAPGAALAEGKACPLVHDPVCALGKDGQRMTMSSACHAGNAGARVLHKAACEGGDVCTTIYAPVCATDPDTGKEKTYPSLCVAEHGNAALVHDGECKS
jgi:hypothetical protein